MFWNYWKYYFQWCSISSHEWVQHICFLSKRDNSDVWYQHKCWIKQVINLTINNSVLFVKNLLFAGDILTVMVNLSAIIDMQAAV
jgi:hypothetical protein